MAKDIFKQSAIAIAESAMSDPVLYEANSASAASFSFTQAGFPGGGTLSGTFEVIGTKSFYFVRDLTDFTATYTTNNASFSFTKKDIKNFWFDRHIFELDFSLVGSLARVERSVNMTHFFGVSVGVVLSAASEEKLIVKEN